MTNPSRPPKLNIMTIGLAMFSMFFGSGNIVFPVLIGQSTQAQAPFAILGLIITAVAVPFCGLLALSLFDGNYIQFFTRIGKIPGWGLAVMIVGLIGPLAGLPRCIVISHAAFQSLIPDMSLSLFSAASCVLIYACTYKRHRILDILGIILTPFLLFSLVAIIVRGLIGAPEPMASSFSRGEAFLFGLVEGYNTLDLFASFMFSSVVLSGIKKARADIVDKPKELTAVYLKSSLIGMGLLAAIYWGMCSVAARFGHTLSDVPSDRLLGALTLNILGPYAGLVVCTAVSLACLTTAISLALVFTEFLAQVVSHGKLPYQPTLMATLAISWLVSTLKFEGIQKVLVPILQISLPSLMVLTAINLAYKFSGFRQAKLFVAATFGLTLLYHLLAS